MTVTLCRIQVNPHFAIALEVSTSNELWTSGELEQLSRMAGTFASWAQKSYGAKELSKEGKA